MNIVYIIIGIAVFGILIAVMSWATSLRPGLWASRCWSFPSAWAPEFSRNRARRRSIPSRCCRWRQLPSWRARTRRRRDPRAFTAQRRWKRLIILAAGAFMNFILGAIIVFILTSQANVFRGHDGHEAGDGFPAELTGARGPDGGRQARLNRRRAPVLYGRFRHLHGACRRQARGPGGGAGRPTRHAEQLPAPETRIHGGRR